GGGRPGFIYDYFAGAGRGGSIPRCGTCDVCLGWRQAGGRPLDDRELERVRIALSAVARLDARFGVERIAQVLTGSRSREVLDRRLDRLPTFGRLAALRIDEVKALLDTLPDGGLLERRGIEGGRPGAFVLALTPEGAAVMRGETRPLLALDERPAPAPRRVRSKETRASVKTPPVPAPACRDPDPDLLLRLKAWRVLE